MTYATYHISKYINITVRSTPFAEELECLFTLPLSHKDKNFNALWMFVSENSAARISW